uniref:poly(ethylene terephthalate) hydrolase family protein n=1 Tax=Clavibacter michiganensis TaxID=28447 RepID=UPI0013657647|nr:hypothetical protein [Clavibacter michiganensis]
MSCATPVRRAGLAAVVAALAAAAVIAASLTTTARAHAASGPLVDEVDVPRSDASGFGGGVVFAPEAPTGTVLGAVVITPGFRDTHADMRWYGEALADAGYVAFTIDTLGTLDLPARARPRRWPRSTASRDPAPPRARSTPRASPSSATRGAGPASSAPPRHATS